MIEKGKCYSIKGTSKYFEKKYGTTNPVIVIEAEDEEVFGRSWRVMSGNPTCMLYAMRTGLEDIPTAGKVYYGHIDGLGELVHESELEEIE